MSVRIVVVDDQEVVRAGFAACCSTRRPTSPWSGTAADGAAALPVCREQRPDIVLLDVRMPVMDGIDATARILRDTDDADRPRILMVTTFDVDEYVYDALSAGCSRASRRSGCATRCG